MSHTRYSLLLTTALLAPLATTASAQTSDTACADLSAMLDGELAPIVQENEDALRDVAQNGDVAECEAQLVMVRDQTEAVASDTETAEVADTAETTLRLEDEVTVRGTVYLDRTPPQVDVAEGETDVQIEPGSPDITVSEQSPEIIVRQAAAEIMVDIPAPTIRISQPAPEIIITMPDPNVTVGAGEPKVEVRQAEPTVTVSQAPPAVELELSRAQEGEEAGIQVNDRRTGTSYGTGEAADTVDEQDAEVSVTRSEPKVTMIEPSQNAQVQIERAEPTVRFEQAEPTVQFGERADPTIEYSQAGEPQITFQTAQAEGATGDDAEEPAAAMGTDDAAPDAEAAEEEAAMPEGDATDMQDAAETDEAATDMQDAAETDEAATDMQDAAETDMATAETDAAEATDEEVVATEAPVTLTGPSIERDGYTRLASGDIDRDALIGANVFDINDEDIGEVDSVMDGAEGNGQIVIGVGGFLGLGEKDVALPMDRFTVLRGEGDDYRLYVDATEEELESMPSFDE